MAIYSSIRQVSDYLKGLDFVPDSSDYRYFYYTDSVSLQTAITNMPKWMRIFFSPPWA
jgi:hypothetical protein